MSPGMCVIEAASVATCFHALHDQGVRAGLLCCSGFADRGDGDPDGRAGRLEPAHLGRRRAAEGQRYDWDRLLAEQVQLLAVVVVVPPWSSQRDAALLRFIAQLVGVGTDFGCAHPVAGRSE